MRSKKLASMIFAFAVGLVLLSAGRPALANTKGNCTVASLFTDNNRMVIMCASDGTGYYVFANQAGCASQTGVDEFKIMSSIVQSAFLSGKFLDLGFNPINGSCGVAAVYGITLH